MIFKVGQRVVLKKEYHCHVTKEVINLIELPFITVDSVQEEKGTFSYKECIPAYGKTALVSMDAFIPYSPFDKPWAELDTEEKNKFLKAIIEAMFTEPEMSHKIANLICYQTQENE